MSYQNITRRVGLAGAAALAAASVFVASPASAADRPAAEHSAKGRFGNVYEYDTAAQRAFMASGIAAVAARDAGTRRMLQSFGSRLTITSAAAGIAASKPRSGRARYRIGLRDAAPESYQAHAMGLYGLLECSSAGRISQTYVKAVQAKLRRANKRVPAASVIRRGVYADYQAAVFAPKAAGQSVYLTPREMSKVTATWREVARPVCS